MHFGYGVVLRQRLSDAGDCRWTFQQNQSVISALKKDNKDLKALLAQLPVGYNDGKVTWLLQMSCESRRVNNAVYGVYCSLLLQLAVETELRSLDLQASSLRKQHDKLVQDRLSSNRKLAQLKDNIRVRALTSTRVHELVIMHS